MSKSFRRLGWALRFFDCRPDLKRATHGLQFQQWVRSRCAAASVAYALLASAAAIGQPASAPAAPAPEHKLGLIEAIGRWFDQGGSSFRENLQGAKRTMDEVGEVAAADAGQSDEFESIPHGKRPPLFGQ